MAEHCTASFFYLLGLILVAASVVRSDSVRNYIEVGLSNEKICNPSTDKVKDLIDLRDPKMRDSAIMVKPAHVFDTWKEVQYHKRCKFKIKATKGDGLFAVIQKMSLRRKGSKCIDYIKFKAEHGVPEKQYCGKLENFNGVKNQTMALAISEYINKNSDDTVEEHDIFGMYEEFSSQGKITTEIFISKDSLLPGETLDLVIAYTPYRVCSNIEKLERGNYWSSPVDPEICINNKFVCDGFTNCASTLCSEENNCSSVINRIVSDGTGTKVTVSAVTTIFLCFIIFVLCLWICRKHKKLCWSPDCAGPSTTVSGSTSGLPMERGEQSIPNPPYVSSAPMLEVAVPASLHDKDLPPSYDSLFPSQANAANA